MHSLRHPRAPVLHRLTEYANRHACRLKMGQDRQAVGPRSDYGNIRRQTHGNSGPDRKSVMFAVSGGLDKSCKLSHRARLICDADHIELFPAAARRIARRPRISYSQCRFLGERTQLQMNQSADLDYHELVKQANRLVPGTGQTLKLALADGCVHPAPGALLKVLFARAGSEWRLATARYEPRDIFILESSATI
jgi:hypothetical protein